MAHHCVFTVECCKATPWLDLQYSCLTLSPVIFYLDHILPLHKHYSAQPQGDTKPLRAPWRAQGADVATKQLQQLHSSSPPCFKNRHLCSTNTGHWALQQFASSAWVKVNRIHTMMAIHDTVTHVIYKTTRPTSTPP
eukprot:scpid108794/ scgid30405/ 